MALSLVSGAITLRGQPTSPDFVSGPEDAWRHAKSTHRCEAPRFGVLISILRFMTFLPLEGVPASLGPGLRTASGAVKDTRWHVAGRARVCNARTTSQRQEYPVRPCDCAGQTRLYVGAPELPGNRC